MLTVEESAVWCRPECELRVGANSLNMTARRMFSIAATAALLASAADLMMLGTLGPSSLRSGVSPELLLAVSGVLGTVAIPFYALGYAAIARSIDAPYLGLRRVVTASGIAVGVAGGTIHGATAILMYRARVAGAAWEDPVGDALGSGILLPALWVLAVAASLWAAAAIVYAALAGSCGLARVAVTLNPPLVTLLAVVAAAAIGSHAMRLAIASPNLAHALFFSVAAANVGARQVRGRNVESGRYHRR